MNAFERFLRALAHALLPHFIDAAAASLEARNAALTPAIETVKPVIEQAVETL